MLAKIVDFWNVCKLATRLKCLFRLQINFVSIRPDYPRFSGLPHTHALGLYTITKFYLS